MAKYVRYNIFPIVDFHLYTSKLDLNNKDNSIFVSNKNLFLIVWINAVVWKVIIIFLKAFVTCFSKPIVLELSVPF